MTYTLILLRHGESEWNAKNLFTGWVDVDLTEKGRREAVSGGEQLAEAGLLPDVVHTSLQRRAITTAHLALDAADRHWIPVRRSWRLNERHYGALQGKDKKQTLEEYGEEQFMTWRRSFDVPPPPLDDDNEFSQAADPRYADLGDELPRTECLKDVIVRMLPYWESAVVPDLRAGHTVLVAAHGNSLRGIVKHLDGIGDDAIAGLNIPTGMPSGLPPRRVAPAHRRGRRVPRPRGRRSGRRRGRQPGSLSRRPRVTSGPVPGAARPRNEAMWPAEPVDRTGAAAGGQRAAGRAREHGRRSPVRRRGCRSCSAAATGSRSRCRSRGRRAAPGVPRSARRGDRASGARCGTSPPWSGCAGPGRESSSSRISARDSPTLEAARMNASRRRIPRSN